MYFTYRNLSAGHLSGFFYSSAFHKLFFLYILAKQFMNVPLRIFYHYPSCCWYFATAMLQLIKTMKNNSSIPIPRRI